MDLLQQHVFGGAELPAPRLPLTNLDFLAR